MAEVGLLAGEPDEVIYRWAQRSEAIIITFDEDFADARLYPLGRHFGVVRLRVWPTTIEATQHAPDRLMNELPTEQWWHRRIIVDNTKIRARRAQPEG